VFENRILKSILGIERKEVRGGWRELHNDELTTYHARKISL
jgi:hypothetical protein